MDHNFNEILFYLRALKYKKMLLFHNAKRFISPLVLQKFFIIKGVCKQKLQYRLKIQANHYLSFDLIFIWGPIRVSFNITDGRNWSKLN